VVIDTNLAYQNAIRGGHRDCAYVVRRDPDQQSCDRRRDDDTGRRPEDDAHLHRARPSGTAPPQDVAVLQLQKASNLKTVKTGNASNLKLGRARDGGRQCGRHGHAHVFDEAS
jgi:hypothetical protein